MFYQTTDYSCAPVALMNLASWTGFLLGFPEAHALCKTNPDGTFDLDTLNAVRQLAKRLGFSYHWCKDPSFKPLADHLADPHCAALVGHLDSDLEWHWSFWRGRNPDGSFITDNLECTPIDSSLSAAKAERLLTEGRQRKAVLVDAPNRNISLHTSFRLPAEACDVINGNLVVDFRRAHGKG